MPPNTQKMAELANAESAVYKAHRKLQGVILAMRLHLDTLEGLVGNEPLALKAADIPLAQPIVQPRPEALAGNLSDARYGLYLALNNLEHLKERYARPE